MPDKCFKRDIIIHPLGTNMYLLSWVYKISKLDSIIYKSPYLILIHEINNKIYTYALFQYYLLLIPLKIKAFNNKHCTS